MDNVISLVMSAIGAYFGELDFFVLFTCMSTGISIYKSWMRHTNDKTALQ